MGRTGVETPTPTPKDTTTAPTETLPVNIHPDSFVLMNTATLRKCWYFDLTTLNFLYMNPEARCDM